MKQPYERLSEMIEILGISQVDIVDKTGLPKSLISMYVNNKREPRSDKINLIANAYNVNPVWLMGFDVPMKRLDPTLKAERDIQLIEMFDKLSESEKSIIINVMKSMIEAYEER